MSKRQQQRTRTAVRDIIVRTLSDADANDAFANLVFERAYRAGHVDTTSCHTSSLMQDPKVQAAFKKFVERCIGAVQYVQGDENS